MSNLSKDMLMEVDGIGESYAEMILAEYSTEDELLNDGISTVSEKTGVHSGVVESLFLTLNTDEVEEETDYDKLVDYVERRTSYDLIHFEDGTTEKDEDGGALRYRQ